LLCGKQDQKGRSYCCDTAGSSWASAVTSKGERTWWVEYGRSWLKLLTHWLKPGTCPLVSRSAILPRPGRWWPALKTSHLPAVSWAQAGFLLTLCVSFLFPCSYSLRLASRCPPPAAPYITRQCRKVKAPAATQFQGPFFKE
jgi:hypothetical protein